MRSLMQDEAGFIVSSELALVSTVGVLGMVVGLSEAANNTTAELHDVGAAIRHLDQSSAFGVAQQSNGRATDLGL